jgi:Arc/MetJ-type ribon-helix-helix transcriptional regulator
MPDLKPATFRIDRDILDAMEELKNRDGVPVSETVRRALRAWLERKGVLKANPKRTVTRQ